MRSLQGTGGAPLRRGWLLLAAALLVGPACSQPKVDRSPVGVVRRFVAAVESRDTAEIYALLGPRTRERLARAAAQVPVPKGGKPRAPHEMLFPAWRQGAAPDFAPKQFKLLAATAKTADVEVRGEKPSERAVVHLVRAAGAWRIEFERPPLPPAPSAPQARPGTAASGSSPAGSPPADDARRPGGAPPRPARQTQARRPAAGAAARAPRGSSPPRTP